MAKNPSQREQKLFDSYQKSYQANDLLGALKSIDELLDITGVKAFVSSLKVDLLMQLGRNTEALEAAFAGLTYPNPPSKLYKQHAQLLLSAAGSEDDLSTALNSIDTAIGLYNTDSINEDISGSFSDAETFKYWFDDRTRTRAEMISLRADIKSLLNSVQVYEKVQQIEVSLNQEKLKVIEMMALFTAVIALIFANTQFLLQRREPIEIVIASSSLIIGITWLLYLVSRITNHKTILPIPDGAKLGNLLGATLLFAFCIVVLLGLIYGGVFLTEQTISLINKLLTKG